jgi:ParB family chromosome partitioning protein
MAKSFAPRVSKKNRKTIDLSERLGRDLFRISDSKLLQGAKQEVINLKDIIVKEQVRTKFNDSSLKNLARNIKENGLIQPLVIHREGLKLTLVCGERRYRAMTLNKTVEAPCFVLDDKTPEELMAIQFSENSSREELHYIDKADGILNYHKATKASERKIQAALGISKSEVHRSLLIGRMNKKLKEAGKTYNIEKYVLLEFNEMPVSPFKKKIEKMIYAGKITKRSQLKKFIREGGQIIAPPVKKSKSKSAKQVTTEDLIKILSTKSGPANLDKKTRELLAGLVENSQ